ncbi:hypothetical protein [Paenibacillus arenosi]|uniref:DUF2207 domain-containing protein n=1 Tax=Paenibacillus arenosi TaxID=2774142 RepID=A0ABR9AVN9_9BACL|nr:hypothetical protein [Paenibacillus arenosi]MBD8498193.1 hypothetical protein [Paenibacillus arenosi]
METIVIVFAIIFVLLLVIAFSSPKARNRRLNKEKPYTGSAPAYLGVEHSHSVYPLVKHYLHSWNSEYEERLKLRMLEEFSGMTDSEYSWRKLELDRYFVICAILKEVPMFSSKVDAVWHEMLMFTNNYDQWSTRYMGEKIHHEPAVTVSPTPHLRAWFDWVYSQLFTPTEYTEQLWGKFFRYPLDPVFQQEFVHSEWEELERRLFRSSCWRKVPEAREAATYLIQQARLQMQQADEWRDMKSVRDLRDRLEDRQGHLVSRQQSQQDQSYLQWGLAASVMFIASTTDHVDYEEEMSEHDKSSCSGASACGSSSGDYSGNDNGGSSDSGSGSSCGSSCGSGCGSS